MNTATTWQNDLVPAQLAHLAIYNPSLGPTDETFHQQLVFYYSREATQARAAQRRDGGQAPGTNNDEALREIGLAQGLINFAKTFSNDAPVNFAETEKARLILHELEEGWWIYVSIDLTRIPTIEPTNNSSTTKKTAKRSSEPSTIEYSSREVSPPTLLTRQIAQAHSIFSLHHGPSLSTLHSKLSRDRFCATLDRFWTRFAKTWDVLLHGNPAVDVLSGIKLASGGELGFGVGEEEWGSGERDVLEDMIRHTEGLVETVVLRFGDQAAASEHKAGDDHVLPWCGAGNEPSVTDGVIFGGVGKLSRPSLESISLWMRQLYTFGDHAYGVRDNPRRERRKRRRKDPAVLDESDHLHQQDSSRDVSRHDGPGRVLLGEWRDSQPQISDGVSSFDHADITNLPVRPGIPPPIVSATEVALAAATKKAEMNASSSKGSQDGHEETGTTLGIPDQYMKYLTLGLSTLTKPTTKSAHSTPQPLTAETTSKIDHSKRKDVSRHQSSLVAPKLSLLEPMPDGEVLNTKIAQQRRQENNGHFMIGLRGDLDAPPKDDDIELTEGSLHDETEGHRVVLRTVQVQVPMSNKDDNDSDTTLGHLAERQSARLRILVYARRPFLFCFLFEQYTSSLGYASFYRSIHRNLAPVHKSLLSSTQASNVRERLSIAMDPLSKENDPFQAESDLPIYDLLYDPVRLTVHASLPNIPDPGTLAAEALSDVSKHASWSRLEALSVHSAILHTLESTLRKNNDIERVSKTGRGWWIIWMKIPSEKRGEPETISSDCRTAFIIRKANDALAPYKASAGSRAVSGMWNTLTLQARSEEEFQSHEKITGLGSGGIGFDARKYVESLLSLNR